MKRSIGGCEPPIKVLSLDGGGVRGLFTISVLAELERNIEQETGKSDVKIGSYFDLITGTSIGGILALGLAKGLSARDLKDTFRSNAQLIFPPRKKGFLAKFSIFLKKMTKASYDTKPLLDTVSKIVGPETRFKDLSKRVMIPTINLSTGEPQFFKTPHNPLFVRDGRLKLLDAALATSAAPTYFAPHYWADLRSYFADGGLVANNPSFIGLHEVLRDMQSDFPDAAVSNIKILNIGTLGNKYSIAPETLGKSASKSGYTNLWGFGERLVLATMTANQVLHQNMLIRELESHNAKDNYIFLNDTVSNEAAADITLDNASTASLDNLESRGQQVGVVSYTKNEALRVLFHKETKPFIPQRNAS